MHTQMKLKEDYTVSTEKPKYTQFKMFAHVYATSMYYSLNTGSIITIVRASS